jgi:signal transduction histidine kinase
MLEKDIQDNRQDKIMQDFQRIAGAADKMHALLLDLLELSRVGRIANPPAEVDLVQVAEEAVEMVDASLRAKGVTVTLSPDLPAAYGDRVRLREVFENLIDNAAKYTGDQEQPLIEIGAREAEETVIFVRDNGMGVEPPYHQKIFGLFEKLNPSSDGTGIGLALIKRIIEVHGGKIWVESEGAGKGSTFCFTIPDSRTKR